MRAHTPGRYAALALLLGGLACAGNKAGTDNGTVVSKDGTPAKETPAYKGMERDTTAMPAPTPTDTSSYAPLPTPTDNGTSVAPAAPASGADSTSGWPKDSTGGMVHDSGGQTNAQ